MSYILDALRKADAQRARDSARGISAQGNRPLAGTSTTSRMRPWHYGVAAIGVVAIGWTGWAFYSARPDVQKARQIAKVRKAEVEEIVAAAPVINAGPQREPQPGEPIRMPMMAPMAPVVGSAVQPAPPEPVEQPPVVAQQEIGPRASARSNVRARQPGNGEPSGAVPLPSGGQQPPPGMELPQPTTQPLPIAPSPAIQQQPVAANAPPAPPVAGLPSDAPKLSISGGVYSANRAQRMLIVNGQVFNEGSEISSGVVLEEVKPKIAVLRFKGTRYTVTY